MNPANLIKSLILGMLLVLAPAFGTAEQTVTTGSAATGVTKVVKITHRDATGLKDILQAHLNAAYTHDELSRYAITADPKTNTLIFRAASPEAIWLKDSMDLIHQLDVPPPQATISIALIGRAAEFGPGATELERQTAAQNEWPGAVSLAATRFIAGNEAVLTTPLDAGEAGLLFLQARVAIVDPDARKVLFSSLVLVRPDPNAPSRSTGKVSERDLSDEEMRMADQAAEEEGSPDEGTLDGEPVLALNEVILRGAELQSLGPFPISSSGAQAMLVLKADFGPETPKAAE